MTQAVGWGRQACGHTRQAEINQGIHAIGWRTDGRDIQDISPCFRILDRSEFSIV
jgi:hypothetical protein